MHRGASRLIDRLRRLTSAWPVLLIISGFLAFAICRGDDSGSRMGVLDLFGRDITSKGIVLADWQGYMANPAIELSIALPPGVVFPAEMTIKSAEPRLYFDLPSDAGKNGPKKQIHLAGNAPVSFATAIFPTRQKKKLETSLDILLVDRGHRKWQLTVPVHVIFNELSEHSPTYPISVDFSQDKTGFYDDPIHRDTFKQAVQDWDFYLADLHVSSVPAGSEKTTIFEQDGFRKSHEITNAQEYTGCLLYTYGIIGPEMRSGGEPSGNGKFQTSDGQQLPIRRSGGTEIEADGNYNRLGWLPPLRDEEWWKATNYGNIPNDLYSIMHHEMGHSLFFNPNNPKFPRRGSLRSDALDAYFGGPVKIDATDHFDAVIDPASLHGAFGNEFHGKMPLGRWMITKLDLLCIEAIGYKLRAVDALAQIAIRTDHLPNAAWRRPYQASLSADGGIPFYDWTITAGALPAGLSLDRFTGQITGVPSRVGASVFAVLLRDYTQNSKGVSREFSISVAGL